MKQGEGARDPNGQGDTRRPPYEKQNSHLSKSLLFWIFLSLELKQLQLLLIL